MPLGRLVVAAKENTPKLNPRKTLMNFIDAEKNPQKQEEEGLDSWKQCKHVKNVDGKASCKQYMSLCAMEKCKQRFRETDFFSYKKYLKKEAKKATHIKEEEPKGQ